MSERYPQWKVDLFRNRNNHRCTCRNDHLPGVTSEKFDPWCAIHGDSVALASHNARKPAPVYREEGKG